MAVQDPGAWPTPGVKGEARVGKASIGTRRGEVMLLPRSPLPHSPTHPTVGEEAHRWFSFAAPTRASSPRPRTDSLRSRTDPAACPPAAPSEPGGSSSILPLEEGLAVEREPSSSGDHRFASGWMNEREGSSKASRHLRRPARLLETLGLGAERYPGVSSSPSIDHVRGAGGDTSRRVKRDGPKLVGEVDGRTREVSTN
jgi:hypothetical protein